MGLDATSAMFLCAAKSLGVDFSETLMIGRQSFWPGEPTLSRVFEVLRINADAKTFLRDHKFAEEFFRLLGAKETQSLDASPYENASILHDMNLPVPPSLHRKYSCVYDGGTIEHVFHITQAFKNCMDLVKVGGHFMQVNVANNFAGHGFWQFSPELIFRALSPANGYEIAVVLMREVVPGGKWYAVSDPDELRHRVELCNNQQTYILTIAKRVADVEIFKVPPQQSDYVAQWNRAEDEATREIPQPSSWKRRVPEFLKRPMRRIRGALRGHPAGYLWFEHGFNPSSYRRIDEDSLLHGLFQ